ncbi:MAG: hypothetical protein AAF661_17790 [Pseudomonadota bacterium]
MFFELMAVIALGFGAYGLALLVRKITGGALPRFFVPASAGLAMFAFAIWAEYSWFARTAGGLPPGIEIVTTHSDRSAFRPWTHVAPMTTRFSAVDIEGARRNAAAPDQLMVEVLLFERFRPIVRAPLLVDCVGRRRADIADGTAFDTAGRVVDPQWSPTEADDPLIAKACDDT